MTSSDNVRYLSALAAPPATFGPFTIAKATVADARPIVDLLAAFEEVAFCDWQDEQQMRRLIGSDNGCCYVARDTEQALVGAVVGGVMGTRGTVNHIAIVPECRSNSVGTLLAESILQAFNQQGVKRVFLFVGDDNPAALGFWRAQGFTPTRGEITCEKDL